jgi:hypothetical protein
MDTDVITGAITGAAAMVNRVTEVVMAKAATAKAVSGTITGARSMRKGVITGAPGLATAAVGAGAQEMDALAFVAATS